MAKHSARDTKGVIKLIVGIVHLIYTEGCLEATLVEGFVMCHEGQSFNKWFYLSPNFREEWGRVGIVTTQSVNLRAPVVIVVRLRLNE